MPQPEKAQPLLAFLEFQAIYGSPNFEISRKPAAMSAVFEAFKPWNITLTNVSMKENPANVGEVAIIFNLEYGRITFTVGIGACTLLVTNPDWSQEHLIARIATAGIQALVNTGISFQQYLLNLGMHVKPEHRTLREVSADFVALRSPKISAPTVKARGFSVYADDFSWVVDSSAMYDGALFLKILRSFGISASFQEMAAALRSDQSELLGALHLTVD